MQGKLFSIHLRKAQINSMACGIRVERYGTIHDVYYDINRVKSDISRNLLITIDLFVIEMKLIIPGKICQVDVEIGP